MRVTLTAERCLASSEGTMPTLARYEVLLPLRYNDGRMVEEARHRLCFDEFAAKFGGATFEPQQLAGRWLFGSEEYKDSLVRLVIEVEDRPENHAWFANWKETLEERFDQIDIRMTWHPIHLV